MTVLVEQCSSSMAGSRKPSARTQISLQEAIFAESTSDLNPKISSVIQSARCKSAISSSAAAIPKNKNSTFRGLGCTAAASQRVSVPAVIRTSAEWEEKKMKKKKKKKKQRKNINEDFKGVNFDRDGCVVFPDVWCGPGIGLSAEAIGPVDCVVTRRNFVSGRGKIDNSHRDRERENPPLLTRRNMNPETLSLLNSDTDFLSSNHESQVFGGRYCRHFRHSSPDALAEITMLQNSLFMGRRFGSHDRFSDWRLDVEDMSYEDLLELGEKIGYVSTGLKEDEIARCVRKLKRPDLPVQLATMSDNNKCTVCQDEYEAADEMGKLLHCGHIFHTECIRLWLTQKNTCPVCKVPAVARS